ncbi:MAG: Spy/CpxP family protein refolding chaperone [Nitrospina sp.]|nr:Spy/CpxP family protein refolding chaperone [Nitrospina sp.]
MLTLIPRLANLTIFSFLCTLIYASLAIADPDAKGMESLKGTGSTGSFNYAEDQRKKGSAIGYGVGHQKSEGSKSKSYTHGSKDYSGHVSGSHSDGKVYSSHGNSKHDYSHKKSEGSKSKSYSHGKSGHGKSNHSYKGGHGKSYGHKKGSHGGHGHSPFKHVMHYKNKLGLTDAQIQTIKELDADFKKKIIQAMADHKIAHVELDLQVHSGKVDETKIRAAGAKIVSSKTNKIMAMIDAKIQLLNLLTAEQRKKMTKMH